MEPTVFQQVMRAPFFNMPDAVRALHSIRGRGEYAGRADIQRGKGVLAWLCATFAGLPPSMHDAPTRVEFIADNHCEIWKRDFGGRKMSSKLYCHGGWLHERLGPVRFRYELHMHEGTVYWNVAGARLFGLPLPARLFNGVQCREREYQGYYQFSVVAALPLVGPLIRYEGWLLPADGAQEDRPL